MHVSGHLLLSFSDSLVPAQRPHRRSPAPSLPPPLPPRRSRRSFCLKIPSCRCTPAAPRSSSSSSLLQDKVTHAHTHSHTHSYSIFVSPSVACTFSFLQTSCFFFIHIFHRNATNMCLFIIFGNESLEPRCCLSQGGLGIAFAPLTMLHPPDILTWFRYGRNGILLPSQSQQSRSAGGGGCFRIPPCMDSGLGGF